MAADEPESLSVPRNSIAFYEAVARGITTARERMRTALCRLHPLDPEKPYGPELDKEQREAIEQAVEKLVADDPDLAAIDRELDVAIADMREAGLALRRRGLR